MGPTRGRTGARMAAVKTHEQNDGRSAAIMIRRHWLSHSVALSEWQNPATSGPTGSTLQESLGATVTSRRPRVTTVTMTTMMPSQNFDPGPVPGKP